MLDKKDIKVNSKRVSKNVALVSNDVVQCFFEQDIVLDKQVEIPTFFEDENILIACKPKGISTCGTNSLQDRLSALAVHRLDTNTSGLVLFAKNEQIKEEFVQAFKAGQVDKKYICQVFGNTQFDNTIYSAYLYKDAKKGKVFIYDTFVKGSVKIETIFKTIKNGKNSSLVECQLLTGKTHQIRAHLSHLGHFIIGDNKYGSKIENKKFGAKTQRLECFYLAFKNLTGKHISYLSNKKFVLNNSKIWGEEL